MGSPPVLMSRVSAQIASPHKKNKNNPDKYPGISHTQGDERDAAAEQQWCGALTMSSVTTS